MSMEHMQTWSIGKQIYGLISKYREWKRPIDLTQKIGNKRIFMNFSPEHICSVIGTKPWLGKKIESIALATGKRAVLWFDIAQILTLENITIVEILFNKNKYYAIHRLWLCHSGSLFCWHRLSVFLRHVYTECKLFTIFCFRPLPQALIILDGIASSFISHLYWPRWYYGCFTLGGICNMNNLLEDIHLIHK